MCSRPDAGTINDLLRSGRSARSVASEVGISDDAAQRHAARHLNATNGAETPANRRKPQAPAGDPLDELVEALRDQALAGNPALVHQYRLALAAQAAASNASSASIDLATTAEWIELRGRILAALAPFPESRLAVADALEAER